MAQKSEYFREIPNKVGSSIGSVTQEEIDEALSRKMKIQNLDEKIEELKRERDELVNTCSHTVLYDEEGFMYDFRSCAGCGSSMGMV